MTGFFRRLRARWRYRHFDRDLAREIEVHRAMAQDALEAGGATPGDARTSAGRALGNVTIAREDARAIWIARWLEHLWQDLRYAVRGFRRQPLFAITAIAILSLSTGLLTTVVMVADAAFLQPWRIPAPNEVFLIRPAVSLPSDLQAIRVPEYEALRSQTKAWKALSVAYRGGSGDLAFSNGATTRAGVAYVTANYFDMLGVRLSAGRMFSIDEASVTSPGDAAIISHRLWTDYFEADPAVLGATLRHPSLMAGRPMTIIGVGPRHFVDGLDSRHEVWVPAGLRLGATPAARAAYLDPRHPSISTMLIGRLNPSVSEQQGLAEIQALSNGYRASAGIEPTRFRVVDTRPLSSGNRDSFNMLLMFACAMLLVQLLACANVGNLLLARAAARRQEVAVRLSLGATRRRIIRQLLTEAAALILVAAFAGLVIALALPYVVVAFFPDFEQRPEFFGPGLATMVVFVASTALCTRVAGLTPALRAANGGLSLFAGNRHGATPADARLRRLLLGAQVALATVLLAGAGLLTRGLSHAATLDVGFEVAAFQEVTIALPPGTARERRVPFFRELFARTQSPGWPAVALAEYPPIDETNYVLQVQMPSETGTRLLSVLSRPVSSNYFDVLGVRLLAGRRPSPESAGREIVINRKAAELLWPAEHPIGKTVSTGSRADRLIVRTVVGLVPDLPTRAVNAIAPVAYSTTDFFGPRFVVRSRDAGVVKRIEALAKEGHSEAIVRGRPIEESIADSLFFARVGSQIAWAIGGIGLVLAAIGAFGVFAYAVEERKREIGVRMALGARAPQVIGLVLRTTQWTVGVGLLVGVMVAAAASPLLRRYLYGLSPFDPLAYAQVAAILATAALLATWIPARRAARVDPAVTLRSE